MGGQENEGFRVASFMSGSRKVTINPLTVTYLRQLSETKTTIYFGGEQSINVDSPIGIVEEDLFPNRRFAKV